MRRSALKSLLLIGLTVLSLSTGGIDSFAQSDISIIDISPAIDEVSEQVPPAPARIALFAWQGVPGTVYGIRFSAPSEPSLVVGIGAEILTTSYDAANNMLSVFLNYEGDKILGNENIVIPDNTFLVALDPGADGNLLPASRAPKLRSVRSRATKLKQSCYGPGANPDLYEDDSGDFGEDDGLNDPIDRSDGVDTVGLPQEAAGTFASTNTFFWCIVPPQGETQGVGLRLLAEKGARAKLQLSLSPGMLDFMGDRLGRTLTTSNLGIFSDELQVGVDVSETADGSAISITLPVNSDSTKIESASASAVASRSRAERPHTARATAADSFDQRTISVGVKEALTLSPDSLKVVGDKVVFSGFVDDLSLVGEFVEIIRIGGNQKCGVVINAVAIKGTVIARGEIKSDGSYNVKIPASAVFNNKNSKSKLVARIPGDSTRTSREVSLSNRNRDLRQ